MFLWGVTIYTNSLEYSIISNAISKHTTFAETTFEDVTLKAAKIQIRLPPLHRNSRILARVKIGITHMSIDFSCNLHNNYIIRNILTLRKSACSVICYLP